MIDIQASSGAFDGSIPRIMVEVHLSPRRVRDVMIGCTNISRGMNSPATIIPSLWDMELV